MGRVRAVAVGVGALVTFTLISFGKEVNAGRTTRSAKTTSLMKTMHLLTFRSGFPAMAILAAFTLPGELNAAVLAFNATSSGTWTADDSAAPLVTLAISHPSITASGFAFAGLTADETVDTSLGVIFTLSGSFAFTGTGGDELFGTYTGSAIPTGNPGEFLGGANFLFTGGSGLFNGATGNGTIAAQVQFTGPLEGVSTWEWNGTISLVPEPTHCGLAFASALVAWASWRRCGLHAVRRASPPEGY